MKKCNEDCFNCIYDDCILDTNECIEPIIDTDFESLRKQYNKLWSKYYYYLNRDKILTKLRNIRNSNLEYFRLYGKFYYKNHKNIIKLHHIRQLIKRKKSNYINWYNKYLEFCCKPLIENPYKKLSVDERFKICKENFENFKKLHGIKSRNFLKNQTTELSDDEKQLKKEIDKQYQRKSINVIFLKNKKDNDKNVK